ncbi:hypothetical protein [Streptomyces sp. TE33382]
MTRDQGIPYGGHQDRLAGLTPRERSDPMRDPPRAPRAMRVPALPHDARLTPPVVIALRNG